jgi:hypothetical protein
MYTLVDLSISSSRERILLVRSLSRRLMLSRSACQTPHQRRLAHTNHEHIQHNVASSGPSALWEFCRRLTTPCRAACMASYHSILDLALRVHERLLLLFLGAVDALPPLDHLCL